MSADEGNGESSPLVGAVVMSISFSGFRVRLSIRLDYFGGIGNAGRRENAARAQLALARAALN